MLLRPRLLPKVWGGGRLALLGKDLDPGERVGESWELADLDVTSPSGGGGAGVSTSIAAGWLAGQRLRDAMEADTPALLGTSEPLATPAGERFPLLVKYLDAREHLSVQVHPSPAYAAGHPEAHLKTECWLVLEADPGARIFKGLAPDVDAVGLVHAAREGGPVEHLLASEPARRGDLHVLPSGTVHALGGGVLVAEVQTPSDTTFRVYDWQAELDRPPRELHHAQALACLADAPILPPTTPASVGEGRLCALEAFTLDQAAPEPGDHVPLAFDGRCQVLMLLSGMGEVHGPAGPPLAIHAGHTVLVPAACADGCSYVNSLDTPPGRSWLLRVGVGRAP